MSMKPSDPLLGNARGDAEVAIDFANTHGCARAGQVERFIREVYRLAPRVGLDPAIVVAKAANETGDANGSGIFVSFWWRERLNPAGMGVTGDPVENEASPTFATGTEAARAMLSHFYCYAVRDPDECPVDELRGVDPRRQAFIDDGLEFGFANTLSDLSRFWATSPGDATATCSRGNAIWPELPNASSDRGDTDGSIEKPQFLIVAGHRFNNGGGGPHESERTPALARAYRDALDAAGFEVHYLQNEDEDNTANFTEGSLDTVGRIARDIMLSSDDFWVMIDCHYADDGGPRGVFSIYPMSSGLTTAIAGNQSPDARGNNGSDEKFGKILASHLSQTTGLQMRSTGGMQQPGLMAEDHTGVALKFGARLAMFAWTVRLQPRAIRLVVEHGDAVHDAAIIEQPDFTAKAARGLIAAVNEMWGNGHSNDTEVGDLIVYPNPRVFHTQTGAIGRAKPNKSSNDLIHFSAGTAVECDGFVHAQDVFNDDRWVHQVGGNGVWIHRSGIDENPDL